MLTNFRRTALGVIYLSIVVAVQPLAAQQLYQHPPREIVEILDAPAPPVPIVSPAGTALVLATPVQYRPISDLAEPMLHGAGTRINPRNNGPHLFAYYVALKLQRIPNGAEVAIELPGGARGRCIRHRIPISNSRRYSTPTESRRRSSSSTASAITIPAPCLSNPKSYSKLSAEPEARPGW